MPAPLDTFGINYAIARRAKEKIMEIEKKICALVHIVDHHAVGLRITVPQNLQIEKLFPDVFEKYCPRFSVRVAAVAWTVCYNAWKQENAEGTMDQVREEFVGTFAGVAAYQEALNVVTPKLKRDVSVEDVEAILSA